MMTRELPNGGSLCLTCGWFVYENWLVAGDLRAQTRVLSGDTLLVRGMYIAVSARESPR